MAEPPATIPRDGVESEQDVLLATKLHVPNPQPGFVYRDRLVSRLDDGVARGLVLVCAPAGFGKTILLADWARRRERPVAWLSLDEGDNDPVRFWRHVTAALDRACPGIAERVVPLLGPPPPLSFDRLVTALVNELAAQPNDVVLIIDDYQLVEAQQVHASLAFLLDHLPPGLQPVLASRADPPLPLARLRAYGRLVELRAADLRFTAAEAVVLQREAVGNELSDAAAAALAARTEGWAAGLQLAALSLREQPDIAESVAAFSGSHRYVLDYLTEEVLECQPELVREFLLETSILERLNGPLCDAVTGRDDGQAMLESIERANLFLVALDEMRRWWRYHQLFADLLRARLEQQRPERVAELHRNAGVWHEDHRLPDGAIHHAMGARDPEWAARLIERFIDELLLHSEGATVRRWLAALPPELIVSRPRLLVTQAILAGYEGRLDAVEAHLDATERALERSAREPYEPSVGRAASGLANIPAAIATGRAYVAQLRGDAESTASFAERALDELDTSESMHASVARGHLAVAEWLRGRLAEAERIFESLIDEWLSTGEPGILSCLELGQVQYAQGHLDAALRTYGKLRSSTAPAGRPARPAAGVAYVGMAEIAYQRGELDTALRLITDGIALCRQLAYTPPLAMGLATLAWIRQAKGDPAGAREAMKEAAQVAFGSEVVDIVNPVPARRARLMLVHGDIATVANWIEERGLDAHDEPDYPREPAYLVLARLLLAQDRPGEALELLGRQYAAATTQSRVGSVIEIQVLRSLAFAAIDDKDAAIDSLAEALRLGCPQGHIRVFADEGTAMAGLLSQFIAAQRTPTGAREVPLDYLARILPAFDPGNAISNTGRRKTVAVPGLVEQLTTRELEVLQLIAAGKSNRHIAEELVVTLDTVKKHVSHVLDKLGAGNRTEAVSRARDLGLIR